MDHPYKIPGIQALVQGFRSSLESVLAALGARLWGAIRRYRMLIRLLGILQNRWGKRAAMKERRSEQDRSLIGRRFAAAMLVLIGMAQSARAEEPREGRVLFLGNSVFHYEGGVCQAFEGLCQEVGYNYQAVSQRKAPANSHGVEFLGLGRIPNSLPEVADDPSILALIRSGRFAYVVLEARRVGYLLPDWSDRPTELGLGDPLPYERNRDALIRLHQTIVGSGAKTVLYMHPGHHSLVDWKHPVSQVYGRLHRDLERVEIDGSSHKVIMVPASLFWLDAKNRFGVKAWYANSNHGTSLARFASGCMLSVYLTGNDPRGTSFRTLSRDWDTSSLAGVKSVPEDDAAWIKTQIWRYYTTRPR